MSPALKLEYEELLRSFGLSGRVSRFNSPEGDRIAKEVTSLWSEEFQGGPNNFTEMLQLFFGFIEESAAERSLSCPIDVFVGEFPTGSFNAQAVRSRSGALLLINNGLMSFVHQCAKIFVHSSPIPRLEEGRVVKSPRISEEEALKSLAFVVIAYLLGEPNFAPRLPLGGKELAYLTSMLTTHAEWFVLAHEYGHAIAGHLTEPQTTRTIVSREGSEVELVMKSWKEEVQADVLGMALLLPPSVQPSNPSPEQFFHLQTRLAGPFLFFVLEELISSTVSQLSGIVQPEVSDHPPTALRMEMIHDAWKAKSCLILADSIVGWFRQRSPDVVALVKELLAVLSEET